MLTKKLSKGDDGDNKTKRDEEVAYTIYRIGLL